jgi:hypothetical protein
MKTTYPMTTTTGTHQRAARWGAMAMSFFALVAAAGPATAERVTPLLVCSKGPSGQRFNAVVTLPSSAEPGAIYTVRIDGVSSGKISHFGLNYLHDMTVDYLVPAAAYVDGSARIIPGTGTPNVLAGPRLSYRAGVVTMVLPGRVQEGTDYTPPSISLQLRAVGSPGSREAVSLSRFSLTANAFLVGEVPVSCEPAVKPYPIGTTLITAPAVAPLP